MDSCIYIAYTWPEIYEALCSIQLLTTSRIIIETWIPLAYFEMKFMKLCALSNYWPPQELSSILEFHLHILKWSLWSSVHYSTVVHLKAQELLPKLEFHLHILESSIKADVEKEKEEVFQFSNPLIKMPHPNFFLGQVSKPAKGRLKHSNVIDHVLDLFRWLWSELLLSCLECGLS